MRFYSFDMEILDINVFYGVVLLNYVYSSSTGAEVRPEVVALNLTKLLTADWGGVRKW